MHIQTNKETKDSSLLPIIFFAWACYAALLYILRSDPSLKQLGGIIPMVVESSMNLVIAFFGFLIWRASKNIANNFRRIFGFFTLSFFFVFFSKALYDLTFNVLNLHVSYFDPSNSYVFWHHVPYIACMFFELLAWISIVLLARAKVRKFYVYLPVLITIAIMLLVPSFAAPWKIQTLVSSELWLTQFVIVAFHLAIFILAAIALSLSKSRSAFSLSLGYVLILGADLILDFGLLSQSIGSSSLFETSWFVGELLVLYSFVTFYKKREYEQPVGEWFFALDSVAAQCTFWCFVSFAVLFTIFLLITYVAQPTLFPHGEDFVRLFTSILIIATTFIIVLSRILARRLCYPMHRLETLVTAAKDDNLAKAVSILNEDNQVLQEQRNIENYLAESFTHIRQQHETEKRFATMATQVAHDIRSPLTSLQMLVQQLSSLPEEQRVTIRNATNRINDIANNLLTKYRQLLLKTNPYAEPDSGEMAPELLDSIMDSILSEKRAQYANRGVIFDFIMDESAHGSFAKINAMQFKRILSNLINNSVEATQPNCGIVQIKLSKTPDAFLITITDNGEGIIKEVLDKINNGIATTSKSNGTGLGISSAMRSLREWHGTLSIQSEPTAGTTVTIQLPVAETPLWFQRTLHIHKDTTIIVLDDDSSIHNVWDVHFKQFAPNVTVLHFYTLADAANYIENTTATNIIYLSDYELIGHQDNGLDLINKYNLADHAILVTSHYENEELREQCIQLGIKIIPKSFAPFIKIEILDEGNTSLKHCDFVLIDDDYEITKNWEALAKCHNKKAMAFNNVSDFKRFIPYFCKTVPIYMDSTLYGVRHTGERFAKELYDNHGFCNIHLTTGRLPEEFDQMYWIQSIIGKNPPL